MWNNCVALVVGGGKNSYDAFIGGSSIPSQSLTIHFHRSTCSYDLYWVEKKLYATSSACPTGFICLRGQFPRHLILATSTSGAVNTTGKTRVQDPNNRCPSSQKMASALARAGRKTLSTCLSEFRRMILWLLVGDATHVVLPHEAILPQAKCEVIETTLLVKPASPRMDPPYYSVPMTTHCTCGYMDGYMYIPENIYIYSIYIYIGVCTETPTIPSRRNMNCWLNKDPSKLPTNTKSTPYNTTGITPEQI